MRVIGSSRLADMLGMGGDGDSLIEVNSYHHQAIRPMEMGAGLAVSGTTDDGAYAEALEAADPDEWLFGVQNHPERPEFTPPAFERLWRAFVAAAAEGRS